VLARKLPSERQKSLLAPLTVTHDIGFLVGAPTPFIGGVLGLARLRAMSLGLLDRVA